MLFWSAPSMTETVHSTTAPVVPRTPIEAPSAAIRKPGFASAMTKPSHHVIALRSCLSSTSAFAMPPLPLWPRAPRPFSYQLVQGLLGVYLPRATDSVKRRVRCFVARNAQVARSERAHDPPPGAADARPARDPRHAFGACRSERRAHGDRQRAGGGRAADHRQPAAPAPLPDHPGARGTGRLEPPARGGPGGGARHGGAGRHPRGEDGAAAGDHEAAAPSAPRGGAR